MLINSLALELLQVYCLASVQSLNVWLYISVSGWFYSQEEHTCEWMAKVVFCFLFVKTWQRGTNTGTKKRSLSDTLFVLELELRLHSYSTVQVSIWFWLTGCNFVGKVRTSLKLRSMTTNCIQYAVWHITNNSSGALDGAQPKESMNRPWLHSFYRGFWHSARRIWLLSNSLCLNVSLLAGLYLSCMPQSSVFFFLYQPPCDSKAVLRSIKMLNAGIFLAFLFRIGGAILGNECKRWNTWHLFATRLNRAVHQKAQTRLGKVFFSI